jgi:hypothetical protein
MIDNRQTSLREQALMVSQLSSWRYVQRNFGLCPSKDLWILIQFNPKTCSSREQWVQTSCSALYCHKFLDKLIVWEWGQT